MQACTARNNLKYMAERDIEGYVADPMFRKRDARFAQAGRHKPAEKGGKARLFRPQEFRFAEDRSHCICPAGKRLYRNGGNVTIGSLSGVKFHGTQRDCGACALRDRCLKHPDRTPARQVVLFTGRAKGKPPTYSALMKHRIDTEQGRYYYSRRLAIVEPVFGNIRSTRSLDRFSLRGKHKVNEILVRTGLLDRVNSTCMIRLTIVAELRGTSPQAFVDCNVQGEVLGHDGYFRFKARGSCPSGTLGVFPLSAR